MRRQLGFTGGLRPSIGEQLQGLEVQSGTEDQGKVRAALDFLSLPMRDRGP
jgi:hypothetical protein